MFFLIKQGELLNDIIKLEIYFYKSAAICLKFTLFIPKFIDILLLRIDFNLIIAIPKAVFLDVMI